MLNINVAGACLNQTPLAWESNLANIKNAIKDASDLGVQLLCLPELCITGYGLEDLFFAAHVQEKALDILYDIVDTLPKDIAVSVGLPFVFGNSLYNVTALIANGKILGLVPKQHLCSDGIHYESRWFKPWPKKTICEVNGIPIGDLVFNINGITVGLEICEDSWVADRPGISLAARCVDIILNPSASHFAFGKHQIRKQFVQEGSRAFKCVFVYSNLVGNEAGRIIFDGDMMIASGGKMIAEGRRLSFLPHMLLAATVDIDLNTTAQLQNGSFVQELYPDGINFPDFEWKEVDHILDLPINENYGIEPNACKEKEFMHAVALGLHDYRIKSKSSGYIVSLSGGADSSAVCCLVRASIDIAARELKTDLNAKQLLTCVYQATENSSEETEQSAVTLATELGADYYKFLINNIVNSYIAEIEIALGRDLTWEKDDIALQNIQARVRLPGIWMLANIKNQLLLCTSNRSEAAVGYTTADGDMGGSLSPIAGIDKTFLLHWLHWLSDSSEMYHAALVHVLKLKPTAELRPVADEQTDEDDLMPYAILNAIEEYAIRDKLSPEEVLWKLYRRKDFGYDKDYLICWINKFFKLWVRNQWKREKMCLSFHLDDHNLDPKTWCRFPILSGGFEELSELSKEEETPVCSCGMNGYCEGCHNILCTVNKCYFNWPSKTCRYKKQYAGEF